MKEEENGIGCRRAPELAAVKENGRHAVFEVTNGVLWYPVGILLALVAASAVIVLCWPGRWIG